MITNKDLEKKLDKIIAASAIQTQMLTDLLEQIDSFRSRNGQAKEVAKQQINMLASILESKGQDAAKFKEGFSFLFDKKG